MLQRIAAIVVMSLAACARAGDPPTIAKTGDWRADVHRFVAANLKHPAWGLSHSERNYELAKELAAADQVTLDDDILYAAAYLHDVAAFAPFRSSFADHQDEAARLVESLLAGTGFPMSKIEGVRAAIRTHMYERDPCGSRSHLSARRRCAGLARSDRRRASRRTGRRTHSGEETARNAYFRPAAPRVQGRPGTRATARA